MIDEYKLVIENGTWELIYFPINVKPIICKWVYIIKYQLHNKIDKYKAILVAKGFS